jgi:hypothetical protein
VVDHYRLQGLLTGIDDTQPIEIVAEDAARALVSVPADKIRRSK